MQTVVDFVKKLDMSAETAVEKLRYMLFEIEGVECVLDDEMTDILIDVDDDPDLAEEVRSKRLAEIEKAEKRKEQQRANLKKAAAKRKAKAAAKKKATAKKKPAAKKKKAATKKKPAAKKKKAAAKPETETEPEAEIVEATPDVEVVEIVDEAPAPDEQPVAEILPAADETPAVEIIAPEPEASAEKVAADAEADTKEATEEPAAPVRPAPAVPAIPKSAPISDIVPDPEVVAEVQRRAAERVQRMREKRSGAAPGQHQRPGGPQRPGVPPRRGGGAPHSGGVGGPPGPTPPIGPEGPSQPQRGALGKTARKKQKKAERRRTEEARRRDAAAALREYQMGTSMGPRKRKKRRDRDDGMVDTGPSLPTFIEVDETISVEEIANQLQVDVNDVILELMDHNLMATKNQALTIEQARLLADPRGVAVQLAIPEEEEVMSEEPDDPADLEQRAPVVTVMGHVDHGKTTLLDRLRHANVAEGEAGGITQHIAAYDVAVNDHHITFLDTPGHEAFTALRARGAQVTDLVILVVAADDGIKPQTKEAIDHARAAEVPIVVAINKCDKPDAQPDRVRQELTGYDLTDEAWGGQTSIKNISATTGDGVDELMEQLVLEAEMLELKANPNKLARGTIIESELSMGHGPVGWVLVQGGTLKVGDGFLVGATYGRVRTMHNSKNETVTEAGPSTPVLVTGFEEVPSAGDQFVAVEDERVAREIASKRTDLEKQKRSRGPARQVTLEDFHEQLMAGEKSELNILIKADVQGSVDALKANLMKLGNEEVALNIVHAGVGGINESDVLLASASDAVIVGFNVAGNPKTLKMAELEGVDIKTYRVIYELIETVRLAMEGLLTPDEKEVITGHAEIRAVFRSSALGNIAGCYVTDGEIKRDSKARLLRDQVVVYEGKLDSLRREKNDAASVSSGFECGIKLERFNDIKEGDVIEVFHVESIAKTLA